VNRPCTLVIQAKPFLKAWRYSVIPEVFFTERYVCTIRGHVYDPEKGEPRQNIAPGIAFADLPAGWLCPVCTATKGEFVKG
jgi:rubredoxin